MKRIRVWSSFCLAGAFAAVITSCAGSAIRSSAAPSAATRVAAASVASAVASPADRPTAASTKLADFPAGVYRVQITRDDVVNHGWDNQLAGIWTLTVKEGTFRLECRPVANPGEDCGNHNATAQNPSLVEIGQLRGPAPQVWFVENTPLLAQLTGCERHSDSKFGCGSEDAYRMDWKRTSNGMEFSNFVGIGDYAGASGSTTQYTAKPWNKIA